jgi:hypothetical protein
MPSRSTTRENSSEHVVNSSQVVTILTCHYEQLLKHSAIVLWFAIIASCFAAMALIVFVSLAVTDPTGMSTGLLTLATRFGLPALFPSGLFWFYDRLQRRMMELARQLSSELDSAHLAPDAIQNSEASNVVHGRNVALGLTSGH